MTAKSDRARAAAHNEEGLVLFKNWDIAQAIETFQKATGLAPDVAEYHLNLARAYARGSEFDQAMTSLGTFLANAPQHAAAARYERLFSSALDEVEALLTVQMPELEMSIPEIGKAMQMWLEFRITIGERPLRIPKPELWAAALTYTIVKINFEQLTLTQIAKAYGVKEKSVRDKYDELVETLDLMPADYRYFIGEENPLDKLVEAASLLEDLDRKFREE